MTKKYDRNNILIVEDVWNQSHKNINNGSQKRQRKRSYLSYNDMHHMIHKKRKSKKRLLIKNQAAAEKGEGHGLQKDLSLIHI